MINSTDTEFMTRLFGPRVEGSIKAMFEDAKAVNFDGDDYKPALDALVASVVHGGIGEGVCMGWSFTEGNEGLTLSVLRVRDELVA